MAEGLNRVTLLGNLGDDPQLRSTQGGAAVLSIRLATSESYLDRDQKRQERTEWHSVVVWGARAEGLSRVLAKGDRILVEGSLRTRIYEDREGNKRQTTEIHAQNIVLAGRAGDGGRGRDDGQRQQRGHGRSGNARSAQPADEDMF